MKEDDLRRDTGQDNFGTDKARPSSGKKEEGKLCSDIEEEKSADFDDIVI